MKKHILMVVKTYPTPSRGYGETVCTAGIDLETGQWVRIYPFPFRTTDAYRKFKKYEVFEFNIEKADARDKRPESYRLLELTSARKIEDAVPTKNKWAERMRFLLPTLLPDVRTLKDGLYSNKKFGRSIALVQVQAGSAQVSFESDTGTWDTKDNEKLLKAKENLENNLFSTPEQILMFRTLEKLPFKFRLQFTDMSNTQHDLLITDWEIGALFLKQRKSFGDEKALADVKHKIEQEIFSTKNNIHLILGSVFAHLQNAPLVVIGFVYPKI